MNLEEVHAHVRTDDNGKRDTILRREDLAMENGRISLPYPEHLRHPHGLALSTWATTQVCQRLGVPTGYFRRCPTHLQDSQFNHWVQHHGNGSSGHSRRERWMLRTRDDSVRGVLAERYAPLDNADILEILTPMLEPHYQVGWFALTDESMHLRVVDPRLAREVLPNDRLIAGIHLANSEVGKRAVTVDALVFRLVCSNGLVRLVKGANLLYRRHLSWSKPQFQAELRQAMREALLHGVGFIERLSWSTEEHIQDVDGTLQMLGSRWNWNETLQTRVRESLKAEPRNQQETLYGLVNAVTQAAQELPADDRYDLEVLAAELIERGLVNRSLRLVPPRQEQAAPSTGAAAEEEELPLCA